MAVTWKGPYIGKTIEGWYCRKPRFFILCDDGIVLRDAQCMTNVRDHRGFKDVREAKIFAENIIKEEFR